MCGRFVATASSAAVAAAFDAAPADVELPPRYNVAPTNPVYGVVAVRGGGRRLEVYRWGLVPSWAKDRSIGSRLINARAETVAEKPSFRRSFASRRLLVPMDGFYEWMRPPSGRGPKQPVFVHRADGAPLAAAGLWSAWRDPERADEDEAWLHTCALVTTSANALMAPVHDRMPVVLERGDWDEWLDPSNDDVAGLEQLLRPAADGVLDRYAVGTEVNRVGVDHPGLVVPLSGDRPIGGDAG